MKIKSNNLLMNMSDLDYIRQKNLVIEKSN